MSREQYVFYSECRQASFTYRKCKHSLPKSNYTMLTDILVAKRFRDFINTSAYLDLKPNDDVVDVLGFLAFESVRSLCVSALSIRDAAVGIKRSPPEKETDTSGVDTNGHTTSSPNPNGPPHPYGFEAEPPLRTTKQGKVISNWKAPPTLPLLPVHITTAYSRMQRQGEGRKNAGLRNWTGGARKGRIGLI